MTGTARLADVDVLMVDVADLADGGLAVHADIADLAGGHTDLGELAVLRHELGGGARRADQLCAPTGVHLDVVDDGANRDGGNGQAVARLDIGGGGGDDGVARLQADGGQDIPELAVLILQEGDEGAAVGVVFQALDGGLHVHLVALEVDDAVLALVAAAAVADGDVAIAVAAGVLLDGLEQTADRLGFLIDAVEGRNGHVSSGRRIRLKCFDCHIALHSFPDQAMPSKNSIDLESSVRRTIAFFQLAR